MATITAGDFRNGKTFEMDGKIMQVVEFQHVKPGKGAAFVRTKMKNVVTGAVTETSFNPTAKFEEAFIERKDYEYSYNDGDLYYFMDQETYDMVPVSKDMLDDSFKFIKENTPVKLLSYKGNVFSVETPNFVELIRASRATPPPTSPSPRPSRRARRSRFPCSSTRAKRSRSTPARANIWAESRVNPNVSERQTAGKEILR